MQTFTTDHEKFTCNEKNDSSLRELYIPTKIIKHMLGKLSQNENNIPQ